MKLQNHSQYSQFMKLAALALVLSGTQTAQADSSFITTGSMNQARYLHTATLLSNGKVFVSGGQAGTWPYQYLDGAEQYDATTGTWTQTGSMTTGWEGRSVTLLLDGRLLVIKGADASADLYDPESGGRIATGAMIASHEDLTATLLLNGKVLVFEGGASGNRAELYDPSTGLWTETGSLNTRRSAPATLLANGQVIVAGGWNNSAGHLASAELYDPATGKWMLTSAPGTPLYGHTATLLPNGKVLMAGGYDGGWVRSCRLYDPATDSWATTGSLNMGRYLHTATLLQNGKVLVAGGVNAAAIGGGGGWLTSTELYDPADETWTPSSWLNARRGFHTATLLRNGKVLMAGGLGDDTLSSAEFYDSAAEPNDRTPPTIIPPAAVVVVTDAGSCEASDVKLGTPGVSDDGGVASVADDAPPVFLRGVTTVTWTATDTAGNTAIATQTVTVEDKENPVLHCPADIYIPCSLDLLATPVFFANATDNCGPAPTVVCSPVSGSGFPVGKTTVHCTATDASGNLAYGSFAITRARLGFTGFLPPLSGADTTGGSFAEPLRAFKTGSTIPVKFMAFCEGAAVRSGIHRLQVANCRDQTTYDHLMNATSRDAATAGNQFRLAGGQWQFNLDTESTGMSKGIWRLLATLSDGSTHDAWIELK